jgi:orotate phosphoribosyltransferase
MFRISAKRIEDPLGLLRDLGGYYSCPKDKKGRRLGPLVGYAGKYQASDGSQKQWVGDVYVNFAKAEENSQVLHSLAVEMEHLLQPYIYIDTFCGAPLGGYSFATMLGLVCERRTIKAEKKVTALATANSREQSEIVFARHEIQPGETFAIVEDVCNNFSTTDQLIELIERSGGGVFAIVCFLNRSLTVDFEYKPRGGQKAIPVVSIVRKPIPKYHQDDLAVRDDIAKGNVVLKPKNEWPRLMKAMEKGA